MEGKIYSGKVFVVITAGGVGRRMGGNIPKQFMDLCGEAVLARTVKAFLSALPEAVIVLTLPKEGIEMWEECRERSGIKRDRVEIVGGGETRFHSIKNAVEYICEKYGREEGIIAVHDGVRPLVDEETIREAISAAEEYGGAVPTIDCTDSVRITNGEENEAMERARVRLVQTPQAFRLSEIAEAYKGEYRESYTDDASVYEANGGKIHLCRGSRENIKITTPIDMAIAEMIIRGREKE